MQRIGSVADYQQEKLYVLQGENHGLLLVHNNAQFYLVENKCGHFGIPLADAEVCDQTIICSGHGISFSLITGEIINRPYETCDSINVWAVVEQDGQLFYDADCYMKEKNQK